MGTRADRRILVGSAPALGTLVLLLVWIAACSGTPLSGARPSTPGVPLMAITPGPQAASVPIIFTATGVNRNGAPINPTSHFAVGRTVYVICRVQGVRSGEVHRLTVRWYIKGQVARWPGAYTYATVAQNGPLSFSLTYLTAGEGMARLYWDEPVGDSNERSNEHFLAQAITFAVQ